MTLKKRIAEELEKDGKPTDDKAIKAYLVYLYHDIGMRSSQIGERYSVGQATVRALMRKLDVGMKAPGGGKDFTEQLKAAGYIDDNDYFGRNSTLAKMDMSKELEVSYSSLCAHYQVWEDQFRAAGK